MIIKTLKKHLIQRCEERGYSIEDIQPSIKSENNDVLEVDVSHPAYPRPKNLSHEDFLKSINKSQVSENSPNNTPLDIGDGVGTELKNILKLMGITATNNCSCNAKAKIMNEKGIEWCKDNIDTIVGWLQEEASKRRLPFFTYGAKKLIKLAIHRAQNASSS
jgi:hypothetical protein